MPRDDYKASRPDPVELLEEMRGLIATMHSRERDVQAELAAHAEFRERADRISVPINQEHTERMDRINKAKDAYTGAREHAMNAVFGVLEALIEDLRG